MIFSVINFICLWGRHLASVKNRQNLDIKKKFLIL
nr:MAG TPA: hypothetical protein [Bacteriophage sp.]